MKAVARTIILAALTVASLQGDVLRLRDGRNISGYYMGGTQKEVWFQSNAVSAEAYPTLMVESLQFGAVNSSFPLASGKPAPTFMRKVRFYLTTILATAWFA
jgi:hypothetical protein